MTKLLKNQRGFTLVELMVVVAIIAILSTIAIPNFRKFQGKAKTSEAKLHLSSIYSAEVAFLSDADVYATCLRQMGYDPTPQQDQRYYATGFDASVNSDHIDGDNVNGVNCLTANDEGEGFFPAGKTTAGMDPAGQGDNSDLENTFMSPTGHIFVAAAKGFISPSTVKKCSSGAGCGTAYLENVVDFVVGQAYANSEDDPDAEDYERAHTITSCSASSGASSFTINDQKNLRTLCAGYEY